MSLGLHDLPNEYRCVQHGVCTYTAPHTILGGVVACRIWSLHDEQLNCWNWIRLQSDELKKCFKKYYATGDSAAKIYGHFLRKTNVEKSISNQQIKARNALFSLSFIEKRGVDDIYWGPSEPLVMLAVVGIHAVMQQLWEWHSFLLMIRPGAEYQFIYLKYSLGSNNYKPSHLFIRPHYSLSSTPTWILGLLLGLGYTAHYWIWGQPIIGHNFFNHCKKLQKFCSSRTSILQCRRY